jgi:ketosteroid isomerase-like protein
VLPGLFHADEAEPHRQLFPKQERQMGHKADAVRALFAAYLANDRQTVDDMLTEDFRFTSPYDAAIDKTTYFARCWRGSDWIARHDLERICVDGDVAFVTYRCVAKDGKSFRNTEVIVFAGDRISRIDVYFGATYRDGAFVRARGDEA